MVQLTVLMNEIPTLSWANMPSALRGAARTVDMFGKMDEYLILPNVDRKLIESDWAIVGQDLRVSVDRYEQEEPGTTFLAESSTANAGA